MFLVEWLEPTPCLDLGTDLLYLDRDQLWNLYMGAPSVMSEVPDMT
jgi:hypothetical protein